MPSRALYTDFVKAPLFSSDDPLEMYLREVRTIPPLTKEDESQLLEHVRAKDDQAEAAARTLVEANLSLVVSVAEQHFSAKLSKLDLIQEGNAGLMTAIDTFDFGMAEAFAAHAQTCIHQAISRIGKSQTIGDETP
jgi:RNA polymerase primary sigma factor